MILQQWVLKKTQTCRPQSHFDLNKVAILDRHHANDSRFLDRTLIEQLDAVIDRAHFRDDVLDEPTITRPLPDKVTKESFNDTTARRNARL